MKIIACLGNPGQKYVYTRHNAGFLCADYISQKYNFKIDRLKFKSLCGETVIANERVLVIKPQTFMNLSGEAVRDAASFYKVPMSDVIVIYDDISLPLGSIRIRKKGSDGGHNGVKSIIYLNETDQFPRIKIGVGSPPPEKSDMDMADWVLSKISKEEQKEMFNAIDRAAKAAAAIIEYGPDHAMNDFNAIKTGDECD